MPIKLIQVQRKLNVGINTVVEFLHRKGFSVEDNPNTRISDEQYALLVKEFGKDMPEKDYYNRFAAERVQKETPSVKEERPSEIKTEIPEDLKPKFVTKGRIDLDNSHKKTQEKPTVKEEPVVKKEEPVAVKEHTKPLQDVPVAKPVPVVEKKPVEKPAVVQEFKAEEKKEEKVIVVKEEKAEKKQPEVVVGAEKVNSGKEVEIKDDTTASSDDSDEAVFRLNTPKFESKIKVTGKIDLNALNQSTRPKKKTKEEKRKERDEKQKFAGNKPNNPNGPFKGPKDANAAPKPGTPVKAGEENDAKKKRKRIKKDRVDVNNTPGTNFTRAQRDERKPRLKKPVKVEVSEEDVQKQIKETLARLTNKGNKNNKGAKYRRDKRDAVQKREHELQEQEERESKILKLTEFVTANDLANMMDVPVTQVIGTCMSIGMMVSINQRLDAETINIVAEEFGFKTEYVSAEVVEAIKADADEDNEDDWVSRPPIVTVMGHVDHGKTSLLDNIRSANVIAGEAGGITQHIGAYNVKLASGRRITFLDTPGHEAFTAMRARGAKVTDIAIIIVAADDNVMPQTIEAINHASAAGVPIVFAINKIDKPHANPEKIKEELANMNYLVEDWGGKYQSQEISAKKGVGIEELLEKVLLEADLLDLKANPKKRAVGSIIESSLDKGRGYVSTVLVENGTLKMGDIVLAGTHHGRIKAMFNERNQRVEKAGPSEPVMILGLNGAPQAGDTFNVLETEQEAREIATRREQLQRELGIRTQKMLTLDDIGRRIAVGNFQELNVIVKGDVDGSVEALSDSLIRLSTEEIQVNVIHKAVGQISESDVVLAAASNAIIIGFQVRPSVQARRNAEKDGVEIRLYSIIYDAIEEVKSAMEGMLSPEIKEEITANVEVQQVFKITKVGTVAGCMVREGKIKRTNKIRLIRDGIVIYSGELGSLKRFKDDVKEVVSGLDCGLNITNFNDIQVGDIIESYEETEVKKTL
ncbi:translation initiation factor IF-2 [Parabacteroides chinchillae]|uniref:Translation initiation factor IF-2 n=1 Tax=Parabacteroides chinchillae TaxID=871327 RepID=A0A8G2BV53_9BACT|nr:translation initiation factor IF-2 [Parabacteroides chinchillae]SEF67129.1 translation initiation factor IF-2 [Parabacteroides chinchillae]